MGTLGVGISQQPCALISPTVLDKGVINGNISVFSVFLMKQNSMFLQTASRSEAKETEQKGTF